MPPFSPPAVVYLPVLASRHFFVFPRSSAFADSCQYHLGFVCRGSLGQFIALCIFYFPWGVPLPTSCLPLALLVVCVCAGSRYCHTTYYYSRQDHPLFPLYNLVFFLLSSLLPLVDLRPPPHSTPPPLPIILTSHPTLFPRSPSSSTTAAVS